jgi:hypothetical protein
MSRYRKIEARIWNDAKFAALSDRGKLVFLFLLTHPNLTMLGAMRATIPGLAAELGMDAKAFRQAFGEAFAKGMVKHDEAAAFMWLPNFLRYNKPESPNVVKAWPHALELVPECALKHELNQQLKAFAEGMTEGFSKAFTEAFAKTMPNQEQEQEQKQTCVAGAPRAFTRPTLEEVRAYCQERHNLVDPEAWLNHYTANGWRVGRNPMKDWRAAVRTWETSGKTNSKSSNSVAVPNHYVPASKKAREQRNPVEVMQ